MSGAALPALRDDLALLKAADHADGAPAWMIHDPVNNQFYRIGWLEFEMLARWRGTVSALLDRLGAETPLSADEQTVQDMQSFLTQNCLLRADTPEASDRLAGLAAKRNERNLRWLLSNYLFIRVPLVRPHRLLAAILPYIRFVYTREFAALVLAATVLGLVLAGRQWDTFLVSVQDSFTPAGVLAYIVALCCAKVLHELGHALTTTRYGLRVAHMGVSFIVLFPMLYTDTSESWKLTDRRQRLAIVAAGMVTELGLAGLATLGWSLAPEGPLRSALFFLATTSWVLTLAINASPFMRFDGYFLLSDALDLPNLHARSFAFGRRWMRRRLLGWDEPLPEVLSPRLSRFLTVFAFGVWLVRLVVFLGIAVAVYLFFFKALGIFLFVVEIAWFIVMPVLSECKVWWARRAETRSNRYWVLLLLILTAGLLLFAPLPRSVEAPGWVRSAHSIVLYAPYPAQLRSLRQAGRVEEGEMIVELTSPDVQARRDQADAALDTVWTQLQRSHASDEQAQRRAVLAQRLRQGQAEETGAREESDRLRLYVPFTGTLTDLDPLIQPGAWLASQQALGVLFDDAAWTVEAFIDQHDLSRVQIGARARVYLPERSAPFAATVLSLDTARTQMLPDPMLDAAHGGSIRVSQVRQRAEVQRALYRVSLRLEGVPPSLRTQPATVVIDGGRQALAIDGLRRLGGMLVRESGF